MKETNLNLFLQLGYSLGYLFSGNCRTGQEVVDFAIHASASRDWLMRFLQDTESYARFVKDSRAAATVLLTRINEMMLHKRWQSGNVISSDECTALFSAREELEKCFERDSKALNVYTVTPKGIYDTRVLLEAPQEEFPERLVAVLPLKFLNDLQQAARCLVFEIPVGCAFHVCRATESLMIAYYAKLAGQPWTLTNRDWNAYIDHLRLKGAPATIHARLKEIKDMDRNAYIHPDKEVSLEEAQVLYKLCSGVNYFMAEEMSKP